MLICYNLNTIKWEGFTIKAIQIKAKFFSLFIVSLASIFTAAMFTNSASAALPYQWTRASVSSTGGNANNNSYEYSAVLRTSMSNNSRYVAFKSLATNLGPTDTTVTADVYVRDTVLGTTQMANINSSGVQGKNGVGTWKISGNGRYVAFTATYDTFTSSASGTMYPYIRDMQA